MGIMLTPAEEWIDKIYGPGAHKKRKGYRYHDGPGLPFIREIQADALEWAADKAVTPHCDVPRFQNAAKALREGRQPID